MRLTLAVALGGAVGALFRYWLSTGIYQLLGRGFPSGTLVVNVLGSAVMGYLWVAFADKFDPNSPVRAGLLVGLLGAFTTFSTFSLETLALVETGETAKAALNVVLSVAFCLVSCLGGMALARALG